MIRSLKPYFDFTANPKSEIFHLFPKYQHQNTNSEDVGWFEVAMHDILRTEVVITIKHLCHDFNGVNFSQMLLLSNVFMKITVRAILQNQVIEVWCLDDLI